MRTITSPPVGGIGGPTLPRRGEAGGRPLGMRWITVGIPLAMLAGVAWALGVGAVGRILLDYGVSGPWPLRTTTLMTYAWPLASAFVLLASGCLVGIAASTTKVGVFLRLAVLALAGLYVCVAIVGVVAPLLRLIQNAS